MEDIKNAPDFNALVLSGYVHHVDLAKKSVSLMTN